MKATHRGTCQVRTFDNDRSAVTFRVRLNEIAKRCYHKDGRLNRWGILFVTYCTVLQMFAYKWLLTLLWRIICF